MWKRKPYLNFHSRKPLLFQLLEIRKRMNRDTIIIVVGEKRIGKSYAAIKIGEKLNRDFDVDKQVFFDVRPFLQWFNSAKDSVCVLDEVSVSYSNREWYSIQNKIFRNLLTVQGYKRNTLIMTLPSLSHLDKTAFDLCHLLLVGTDQGVFRCYRIKSNQLSRKTFPIGFEILNFDKPSEKSLKKYEAMKDKWNKNKLSDDIVFMEALEDQENYNKQLSVSDYLKGFQLGLMDRETVTKKIKRLGYGLKDIEMVLAMEEEKKKKLEDKAIPIGEKPANQLF